MPNPFPGLRPFRPDEANLFTGRETVSDSVVTRVRVAPLTVMFARSGVGKSSFLNCRLVPFLQTESPVVYMNEWGADTPERLIRGELSALRIAASREVGRNTEMPVLVMDQFEDVFKSPRSRNSLWDALADTVNVSDPPAHLLISMREEWLGAWQESEDYLPDALSSLIRLRPLSEGETLGAIVKPPNSEGTIRFASDLAAQLVKDLRRPSPFGLTGTQVEPGLLQLVCRRLWSAAQSQGLTTIPLELYRDLGGADVIVREFVWNELGSAGLSEKEIPDPECPRPQFSAADRVLWAAMTRHLISAHGVKAIVSAEQLARSLVFPDLGIAGRATAEAEISGSGTDYLDLPIEKRDTPPSDLLRWINRVLEAAVSVGFMKRQRTLRGSGAPASADATGTNELSMLVFELSHDALADILQIFKIEFEGWIRTKIAKLVGILAGTLVVLPALIFFVVTFSVVQMLTVIGQMLLMVVVLGLYAGLIWVLQKVMTFIVRLISHPILRRFSRGRLPLQRMRK